MEITNKNKQIKVRKLVSAPKVKLEALSSVDKDILTNPTYYVKMTHCIFEHITSSSELTYLEKLYYILADALCLINATANKGKEREIGLSLNQWLGRLNCSKGQLVKMQKNLTEKGFFDIKKSANYKNQKNKNIIVTSLPEPIFDRLQKTPNRQGNHNDLKNGETGRSYLDRTKQYIRINYQVLLLLTKNNDLTAREKILWLQMYVISQRNFLTKTKKNIQSKDFSFVSTYADLAKKCCADINSLSPTLNSLVKAEFLQKVSFLVKESEGQEARQDKIVWKFNISLPQLEKIPLYSCKEATLEIEGVTKEIDHPLKNSNIHILIKESKEEKESSKKKNFLNLNLEKLEKKGRVANNCTSIHTNIDTNNQAQTNPKSENIKIAEQMIETWNEVFKYALSPIKAYHTKAVNNQLIHIFALLFCNDLAKWKAYAEKVNSSRFCMGEKATKSDFKAIFTWLIRGETIAAILAGGYGVGDRPTDKENISQNNESRKIAILKLAEQKIASVTKQNICEASQRAEFKNYVLSETFLMDNDAFGIMYLSRKYSKWGLFELENQEIYNYAFERFLKGRYFALEQASVKEKLEQLISSKTQAKSDYEAMLELEAIKSHIAAIDLQASKSLDSFAGLVEIAA